jgi:beta-phosphoglucomutase-like phosphatase (HAD superfamily)
MDGVVTDTARSHAESWAAMFNEYLANREETQRAFTEEDYLRYVDGKPCYDGVRSFLHSRGIDLPEGTSDDPPGLETVCGLGNRKNDRFLRALEDGGADAYPSTLRVVEELHRPRIPVAVITSSRNSDEVLCSAGVRDLFAEKVDGNDCAGLGLAGKAGTGHIPRGRPPLGVDPERTAVVENALAGVEAGRRGDFGPGGGC